MAAYEGIETQQLAFNQTTDVWATFGDGVTGAINGVYVSASANCYVAFDKPATAQQGFLLSSSITNPLYIDLRGNGIKQVHCIGSGASGTLYIIGTRA